MTKNLKHIGKPKLKPTLVSTLLKTVKIQNSLQVLAGEVSKLETEVMARQPTLIARVAPRLFCELFV